MNFQPYGISIALTKYPGEKQGNYTRYVERIHSYYKEQLIEFLDPNSNGDLLNKYTYLYSPGIFHLFSPYDIAFISVIDNLKFSQRVFEPRHRKIWPDDETESFEMDRVNYQLITGSLACSKKLDEILDIIRKPYRFLQIIQLKLTNGLVIGNGNELLSQTIPLLEDVLKKHQINDYLILNSYNWSELTLVISHEDPNLLTNALVKIRRLTLQDIANPDSIIGSSLYQKWNTYSKTDKDFSSSHLFNDSHSYIGYHYDSLHNEDSIKEVDFKTSVEWQVKPGHLGYLVNELNENLEVNRDWDKVRFKYGKTDFIIDEKNPLSFKSNVKIFKLLRNDRNQIGRHLRRIITKPEFKLDEAIREELEKEILNGFNGFCSTEEYLRSFMIDIHRGTSTHLKALNVSRHLRKKVRKLIYNYNQGILDPVLFVYYIDIRELLIDFLNQLEQVAKCVQDALLIGKIKDTSLLNGNSNNNWGLYLKTKVIEEIIINYLEVFEEALEDRHYNTYNFEDINQYNLGINSSNASILSSIDAIAKFYARIFRENTIVTRMNYSETVSNSISVNYNVDQLNCPPLVFATLFKEISNNPKTTEDTYSQKQFDNIQKKWEEIRSEYSEYQQTITDLFLFEYFEADIKKYYLTFYEDQELFTFWHWTYALQNTSIQSTLGCFDENNFVRELFRLMLISKVIGFDKPGTDINQLECPAPELKSFWLKHKNRIKDLVSSLTNGVGGLEEYVSHLKHTAFFNLYSGAFNYSQDDVKKVDAEFGGPYSLFQFHRSINNLGAYRDMKARELTPIKEFCKSLNDQNEDNKSAPIILRQELDTGVDLVPIGFLSEKKRLELIELQKMYSKISCLSYYSLAYIHSKFDGKISLLPRNYHDGIPNKNLMGNKAWFIDGFGGFFINSIKEREDYMLFTNYILNQIWNFGMHLKTINLGLNHEDMSLTNDDPN